MMLVGRTALSEEIMTKSSTPKSGAVDGHIPGAEDIVLDRREDVTLHQGHVFIRRSVVDDGGAVVADYVDADAPHW